MLRSLVSSQACVVVMTGTCLSRVSTDKLFSFCLQALEVFVCHTAETRSLWFMFFDSIPSVLLACPLHPVQHGQSYEMNRF